MSDEDPGEVGEGDVTGRSAGPDAAGEGEGVEMVGLNCLSLAVLPHGRPEDNVGADAGPMPDEKCDANRA